MLYNPVAEKSVRIFVTPHTDTHINIAAAKKSILRRFAKIDEYDRKYVSLKVNTPLLLFLGGFLKIKGNTITTVKKLPVTPTIEKTDNCRSSAMLENDSAT